MNEENQTLAYRESTEPMMEFEERRHSARTKVECKLTYRPVWADVSRNGVCLNISGSGLLFAADTPIEPGRAMEIHTLPATSLTPPLTAFIEVIRCIRTESGDYHIAGAIKGIKSE